MDSPKIIYAFALTLISGLSTGVGSAISVIAHTTNKKFLSIALGFSAGVMIYVSFVEILTEAQNSLAEVIGSAKAGWLAAAGFFMGIAIIGIIDRLVPEGENPHQMRMVEDMCDDGCGEKKLMRLGIMSAMAIAIHNFPEGIVTFMTSINDASLGLVIAVAVAIHNIPEGIAIAVPIYFATGSRKKAFMYSFFSGFAEPFGAIIAFAVLLFFYSKLLIGIFMCIVAGIMVFISLDELLPAAREYGEPHKAIYGVVFGMLLMAISLLLLH